MRRGDERVGCCVKVITEALPRTPEPCQDDFFSEVSDGGLFLRMTQRLAARDRLTMVNSVASAEVWQRFLGTLVRDLTIKAWRKRHSSGRPFEKKNDNGFTCRRFSPTQFEWGCVLGARWNLFDER